MTLSVLEGVAFALRDCIERIKEFGLPIKRISITGGGCLTKVWPKIICNVLNMPISLVETYRGPSYGAAILAMVGDGKYKDVFEASERLTNVPSFIEPDIRLAEHYGLKYFKYKKLYRAIKSID